MHQKKRGVLLLLSTFSYGAESAASQSIENFWIWVALFALGLVGVLILYISSLQTRKIEKMYEDIFARQREMEKNQALLLSKMSEHIHGMVTKALKKETEEGREGESTKAQPTEEVGSIEDRLLTVTNDLIAFLRLKSGKVEIMNETFNLNNVLNEVSGYICHRYQGKQVDLIFDINNDVPRILVGDSLHLGQVLNSILEYMMERIDHAELKLEISVLRTREEQTELMFHFQDTGDSMSDAELSSLFDPYYDEERNIYRGLGLFVSGELVKMMQGQLDAKSLQEGGNTFSLSLPLKIFDRENRRKYRLPSKVLTAKKVLIVDHNAHAALAVQKTFAYFKHEVEVLSREMFLQKMPNFARYDIVVLDQGLFSPRLLDYLKRVKQEKMLKVIALDSLLNSNRPSLNEPLIDVYLYTPLNQERIFEMIVGMYDINVKHMEALPEESEGGLKIQKSQIHETKGITRQNFKDFAGKHILIVEDNVINQKVLSSLLEPAGVEISIANNGQEAVDMVTKGTYLFDLVLMDINMPILDGYDATEQIRKNPDYDELPIVAFTALVLESEIEKMFKCGINAFLPKPLNIGRLYTALEMFLMTEENPQKEAASEKTVAVEEEAAVSLRGLDIEQGIAHANHSPVLYMEILSEFMEAYGKSDILFQKLVKEHRYEQVRMLCIDMRGLTGTIGAYDMLEVVNKIHHALLYNNQGALPEFIGRYHHEIIRLNHSIEAYLSLSGYKAS
jgi:CheY-like chemotaxis protein/signal transduction histidine kinase